MRKRGSIYQKTLKAYCLMETIVSSVIFMIVFLIGMHVLTQLAGYGRADTNSIVMEVELQKQRKRIAGSVLFPTKQNHTYNWGKVIVDIAHYRGTVFVVELKAIDKEKRKTIACRFLQANSLKSL